MKQKLFKPVITNEKLVAILALAMAITLFTLIKIFFYSETQNQTAKLLRIPENNPVFQQTQQTNHNLSDIRIPILLYRRISVLPPQANNLEKELTILPEDFELQVAWLKGQGYESVKLSELLAYLNNNQSLPKKPVIFTFDDGYQETINNAPVILKKYGFTGDFGVITQFPGISVGGISYASWREIKQAKNQGMEIISQTQDNFDGTNSKYTDSFILRNLSDSLKDLKTGLGADVPPILIYPFGRYDDRLIKLSQEAGFKMGVSANPGSTLNSKLLMQIPRLTIKSGTSLGEFQNLINSVNE